MEAPLTDERRRVEAYLQWVEGIGGQEPRYLQMPDTRIICMAFDDQPDLGWRVGFTYGLSLYARAGVGNELILRIASLREEWLLTLMETAHELREASGQLEAGMTFSWPGRIAPDTAMTAFVLCDPMWLPERENGVVHLPGRHVTLLQAVPLHPQELAHLRSLNDWERGTAVVDLLSNLGEAMSQPTRPAMRQFGI